MRTTGGVFMVWAMTLLLVGFLLADGAVADCPVFLDGQNMGTVESVYINEASGIAFSGKNPGVLWVHNDSGDSARVFAMDIYGNHLGIYNLTGAGAADWEDMAVGPGPDAGESYLYLGDIGDNSALRSSVTVYRVPEPEVSTSQSPVNVNLSGTVSITLAYPDGARDAETLMVDPETKDIYVVSKRETPSRVYRAPYPQSTTSTITMQFKTVLPWGWATGGDISPSGDEILIRGYLSASLWGRPSGTDLWDAFASGECPVPLVSEPQGEAICFDSDADGYITTSEGYYKPIYYFERAVANAGSDSFGYESLVGSPYVCPLNGTDSAGATTYSWAQTGGTTVTLRNASTATPDFDAPQWDGSTELTTAEASLGFRLTINQGKTGEDSDECEVYIRIPGDATGDDDVNAFDLAKLRQLDPAADFNGDGPVNAFDLAILRQNSGRRR